MRTYFNTGGAGREFSRLELEEGADGNAEIDLVGEDEGATHVNISLNTHQCEDLADQLYAIAGIEINSEDEVIGESFIK